MDERIVVNSNQTIVEFGEKIKRVDGKIGTLKQDVNSQITTVKQEVNSQITTVKQEVNSQITTVKQEVDEQFNTKANLKDVRLNTSFKPINYTEFDNETKQKLTGGAVAVVGKNSVGFEELKDNSIINDKINNITLEKITDVKNGGLSFSETKKLYNKTLFRDSKELVDSFTSDVDGLIELVYDTNTSNNSIKQSNIVINDSTINTVKLFPNESVSNSVKDIYFEKRSIKDFIFNTVLENNDTWARVACSEPVSDIYKKDITGYNAITENDNKFISKSQTEFSSYLGNFIGLHSNGTLQIKISKSEVESAGKTFDNSGILEYVNELSDFNIYLRYATKKTENANLTIPVNKGDIVQLNGAKFNMLYNNLVPTLVTSYNAFATNNNNFDVTNRIIKINCDFDYGVLKNLSCIKVKDISGNYIDSQAIKNTSVRYGKPSNSLHRDGSIKNCSILLIDNFSANETKEYILEVYSSDVNSKENFHVLEETTKYTISCNNVKLEFNKSKNNMLTNIYKNSANINSQTNSIPFRLTHSVLGTTNNISDVGTLKEFKITNGTVMCEINTKVEFNNVLHDITYEFYKNGEIRCVNYNNSLNNISNCYGILLRSNTEYTTTPIYSVKNPTSYYEPNGVSTRVVYSNGDVPRDDGYGYPVFKTKALGMRMGETNCYSCICGWEFADSDTKYEIPKDFVFSNCIVINTTSNGKDNAYELNPIVGEIVKDNLVNNKHFIKSNIVRLVKAINPQMEKLSPNDSVPTKFLPSLYARLILAKETDLYNIDEITNIFKSLMVKDYKADTSTKLVNATNLKAIYDSGISPLHMSARVFPICKFLLKEYKKIGNLDEINYFETTIKEYAEFVCQVFEEKGNTPLYGNKGSLNANSIASGCKALSDGLELEENTRCRNALNGNVEVLKTFKIENILKEGNNVSCEQYLHYHTFAAHDYFACSSLNEYIIHPSQYISMCLNSKGEVMDEIWCCSRSRRGLTSTVAYIVFLLVKNNTPQSIQLATKVLDVLWENFNYNGTQNFPLYGFDLLPPQTDESSTPMQLQALCETYYMLEEMGI